jgi:hypothetical protein
MDRVVSLEAPGELDPTHAEDTVNARDLTKRDLLLRQRAARLMERNLPDQIRRAYAESPADERERARAALIAREHLSQEELDSLPVDEAITVALQRVRDQAAGLEDQSAQRASQDKGSADVFLKPPRTLRQG